MWTPNYTKFYCLSNSNLVSDVQNELSGIEAIKQTGNHLQLKRDALVLIVTNVAKHHTKLLSSPS